jgi:hypothetical protein
MELDKRELDRWITREPDESPECDDCEFTDTCDGELCKKEAVMKYLPTDCLFCKENNFPPEGMTGQCEYCGGIFCFGHLGYEVHKCSFRIKSPSKESTNE